MTGDLADLAEGAAAQAAAVLRNGRRAIRCALSGRMCGRLRRALGELAVTIERTAVLVAQARSRLAGQMPDGATRLVSLHDARRRGRSARDVSTVPWSSGTRPRSPTTTTASSWITASGAQPPGRSPARAGDHPDRAARRPHAAFGHRRPRVRRARDRTGTAGPGGTHRRHPAQSQALSRPPRRRACPRLPHPRQVADRLRRPDQLPQAQVRLGPRPAGRPRRSFDLVRARGIHRTTWSRSAPLPADRPSRTRERRQYRRRRSASGLFQGEVLGRRAIPTACSASSEVAVSVSGRRRYSSSLRRHRRTPEGRNPSPH